MVPKICQPPLKALNIQIGVRTQTARKMACSKEGLRNLYQWHLLRNCGLLPVKENTVHNCKTDQGGLRSQLLSLVPPPSRKRRTVPAKASHKSWLVGGRQAPYMRTCLEDGKARAANSRHSLPPGSKILNNNLVSTRKQNHTTRFSLR